MKILIADDDSTIHMTYTKPLQDNGYEVFNAYDGDEAMAMVESHKPEFLVLDISMPGMDGRDICKELKSSPDTEHIRIIMLTARKEHFERRVGIEAGADDYLEKPCPVFYLERAINTLLRKM